MDMTAIRFTAVLAIKTESNHVKSLVEMLSMDLIRYGKSYIYTYDDNHRWLYIYSNQFESISKRNIVRILSAMKDRDLFEYFFLNVYDSRNMLVLYSKGGKTQLYGSRMWNMHDSECNYIHLGSYLIAEFKSDNDNFDALDKILLFLKLDVHYIFTGYDIISTSSSFCSFKLYEGRCKNELFCSSFEDFFTTKGNGDLHIISPNAILKIDSTVLCDYSGIDAEITGISIFTHESIFGWDSNSFYVECYIVLSECSEVEFAYLDRNYTYSNEKIVIRC